MEKEKAAEHLQHPHQEGLEGQQRDRIRWDEMVLLSPGPSDVPDMGESMMSCHAGHMELCRPGKSAVAIGHGLQPGTQGTCSCLQEGNHAHFCTHRHLHKSNTEKAQVYANGPLSVNEIAWYSERQHRDEGRTDRPEENIGTTDVDMLALLVHQFELY